MSKYKEFDDAPSSKGLHRDYDKNKECCRVFVANIRDQLLPGMKVKICDSESLPQSLFEICWIPPSAAKIGRFSHRIFLHQSNFEFEKELAETYSSFHKMVSDWMFKDQETKLGSLEALKTHDHAFRNAGIVTRNKDIIRKSINH